MKKYTLNVFPGPEETCLAAAEAFVDVARQAITRKGSFAVALSGGHTPRRMYEFLTQESLRLQVDWSKVLFFWGDERPVPPNHAESNYRMAQESLLTPLGISETQIFRMEADQLDKNLAAQQYQNVLMEKLGKTAGGDGAALDLVLLGLGDDAHTASLFPATPALLETIRWVVCNPVLKLESERLTLTPMFINRSAHVFFLVTGESKANAVKEVLEGSIDTQRLPAQLIHPADGKLVWFVDEAAGSGLKR